MKVRQIRSLNKLQFLLFSVEYADNGSNRQTQKRRNQIYPEKEPVC